MELKEFLNSDESESDDVEDNIEAEDQPDKRTRKVEKYRALLEAGHGSDGEDGQDMEVTFNTGLEDISKRILEKKDKKSETVWEAHLRKRREKKKASKSKSKHSSSDDDDISDTDEEALEQEDDFFMDDPPTKKRKKEQSKSNKEQKHQDTDGVDKATKEELELLLADDQGTNAGIRGYNLKIKKAKDKRVKETIDEGKIPTADFDDPRFAALFTSPDYVLDPTDPQFKRYLLCNVSSMLLFVVRLKAIKAV